MVFVAVAMVVVVVVFHWTTTDLSLVDSVYVSLHYFPNSVENSLISFPGMQNLARLIFYCRRILLLLLSRVKV